MDESPTPTKETSRESTKDVDASWKSRGYLLEESCFNQTPEDLLKEARLEIRARRKEWGVMHGEIIHLITFIAKYHFKWEAYGQQKIYAPDREALATIEINDNIYKLIRDAISTVEIDANNNRRLKT